MRACLRSGFVLSLILCEALIAAGCVHRVRDRPALLTNPSPFVSGRWPGEKPLETDSELEISQFCVAHVVDAVGMREAEARIEAFEQSLLLEIGELGFGVVGEDEWSETWKRVLESGGPFYDPHLGVMDRPRYERAERAARRALNEEHGCDFIILPRIVSVAAVWIDGRIKWDGADYKFERGSMPGFNAYGTVGALSLHVRIQDLEGDTVYFGTGGIQPTSELVGKTWHDEFEAVPEEEMLGDDAANRLAIGRAVRQMRIPVGEARNR